MAEIAVLDAGAGVGFAYCAFSITCPKKRLGPCVVKATAEIAGSGLVSAELSDGDDSEGCTGPNTCSATLRASLKPGATLKLECRLASPSAAAGITLECFAEAS